MQKQFYTCSAIFGYIQQFPDSQKQSYPIINIHFELTLSSQKVDRLQFYPFILQYFSKEVWIQPISITIGENSSLVLKKKQQEKVIEKRIKINQQNRKYSEMQLLFMKEIDSPYVVKYLAHTMNPEEKSLNIYMKYYPKGDLENYLIKHPFLNFKKRLRMFIDILMGLMELHSRFIIHRDLKLKNIFVDQDDRCVVGDLGIATVTESNAVSTLGTIGNQAPQVYKAQNYNQKVDIWGVGILAYQIFSKVTNGVIPYPFQSNQNQRDSLWQTGGAVNYKKYLKLTSNVKPLDNDIPSTIKDLILRMLNIDPNQRISWVQFYESSALHQFFPNDPEVQTERLIPFKAEYVRMAQTRSIINEYIVYINDFREKYFYKLQEMLKKQNIKNLQKEPRYKKFKGSIHDLHIFFYLLMKKVLSKYDYIKEKNIYRAIINLKDFMKNVKNTQYYIEIRINNWLRDENQKEISKNSKFLKNEYFKSLQQKFDNMLEEL